MASRSILTRRIRIRYVGFQKIRTEKQSINLFELKKCKKIKFKCPLLATFSREEIVYGGYHGSS